MGMPGSREAWGQAWGDRKSQLLTDNLACLPAAVTTSERDQSARSSLALPGSTPGGTSAATSQPPPASWILLSELFPTPWGCFHVWCFSVSGPVIEDYAQPRSSWKSKHLRVTRPHWFNSSYTFHSKRSLESADQHGEHSLSPRHCPEHPCILHTSMRGIRTRKHRDVKAPTSSDQPRRRGAETQADSRACAL